MAFVNWSLLSRRKRAANHSPVAQRTCKRHRHVPQIETLESRRMLARGEIWVDTPEDIVDGNYSSISKLISDPGDDGHISLREAILATNRTPNDREITPTGGVINRPDRIRFDSSLDGIPITLSIQGRGEDVGMRGDLDITESLTIRGSGIRSDGPPESAVTIIDAGGIDRIFDISSGRHRVLLQQLHLTGGRTTSDGLAGSGGAIRSLSDEKTTVAIGIVSGNSTSGTGAHGGAIYSLNNRVSLADSRVTDNFTTGKDAKGGAIWSRATVTVKRSTISNNYTTGDGARGGAIFIKSDAGGFIGNTNWDEIQLLESTLSGNSTSGTGASGGGIFSQSRVILAASTISGNSTTGDEASGGGIHSLDDVFVAGSTISNNSTEGDLASGGGIYADGDVKLGIDTHFPELTQANLTSFKDVYAGNTISGNSTAGDFSSGGGIHTDGDVIAVGSTISNNSTAGLFSDGGGIYASDFVWVSGSTIAENSTTGEESYGGGIYTLGNLSLVSSIAAGNTASGPDSDSPDLFASGSLSANHSLIGDNDGTTLAEAPAADFKGNLIGTPESPIDPRLGPLADNGGPTQTHGLLPGSPAIDAGNNQFEEPYDQRGEPNFVRVLDDRADIGAFEGTITPPVEAIVGDSNRDGHFDVHDLVQILTAAKFATGQAATWEQGDWNGDGLFDVNDIVLALIEDNFEGGVATTEAVTTDAIDQYHREEAALSEQSPEVEQDLINSSSLLATGRRSRSR